MTFAGVHRRYTELRQRLAVHVGPGGLREITVLTPEATEDEISFVRLVSWAYVLFHESGRVAIKFLQRHPPIAEQGRLMPYVGHLRTWTAHNLDLSDRDDLATLRSAQNWFRATCGVSAPNTALHWGQCFATLSEELFSLLGKLSEACNVLDSADDGARNVQDLRSRLDRDWEARRFDPFVSDCISRLGYVGIDVTTFSRRHLDKWRKVVAAADADDIERMLTLRIEADLVELMAGALPLSAKEIGEHFRILSPSDLGKVMRVARGVFLLGNTDRASLIEAVSQNLKVI